MPRLRQRRITHGGPGRRGAALVETAIVLPIFFLVVLGIIAIAGSTWTAAADANPDFVVLD